MEVDLDSSPSPNLPQEIEDNAVTKKLDFSNISNTPSPPPTLTEQNTNQIRVNAVTHTPSLSVVNEGYLLQSKLHDESKQNKENTLPDVQGRRQSARLIDKRRREKQKTDAAEKQQPQPQQPATEDCASSIAVAQDDDDIVMEIAALKIHHDSHDDPHADETHINKEWDNMFLCHGLNWNRNATPIQSSMKLQKTKARTSYDDGSCKKVNWGNVSVRNFEQRCGVLSCGVPQENGPSLHLGKFLSSSTSKVDEYEHDKQQESGKKEWPNGGGLSKKERIARVKQFSPADCQRKKLKQDCMEIDQLQKSRTKIGCQCVSVYKMRKDQLVSRILKLTVVSDDDDDDGKPLQVRRKQRKKELCKLKKKELFQQLITIQQMKYGRYDVCCVDDECDCFRQGIECQIDSVCCACGGDTVYSNYLTSGAESKNTAKKQDSLACANPSGNTLNISVLDFVKMNSARNEHEVVKKAESDILPFASPCVQKRINDWNEHYGVE
mmetsp:Transcript_17309/g.27026  ORF Transcript_17309/g.27026 Transcript_17309/m.27026 type:complete len:494 (-) Transcript_17309:83-1564(-)